MPHLQFKQPIYTQIKINWETGILFVLRSLKIEGKFEIYLMNLGHLFLVPIFS